MQKGENGTYSETEISEILEKALELSKQLHKIIDDNSGKIEFGEMF